jgi:hypothetical protein
MAHLTLLFRELHRRFVWQALVLYLVLALGILAGVQAAVHGLGLPAWIPAYAAALLFLGAPIVLLTTFVQEGVPFLGRPAYRDEVDPNELVGLTPAQVHRLPASRLLTWRNALLGATCASVLFVSSVVAYLGMWAAGVGPMGSLLAQGRMALGETVLVTAFGDHGEPATAREVSVGLVQALSGAEVFRIADATELPVATAKDEAVFRSVRFILEGEVMPRAAGYLLQARLVDPTSGQAVASFRVPVREPQELEAGIQLLSRRIRVKSGEAPQRLGFD